MPKLKSGLTIHLDLLRPQSNTEKLAVRLIRWLLSTGRFIFVFVEALVLVAFIARFKLDADLASKKEAIEEQIPYIEALKPYEILIRQTQLKLSTIETVKTNSADFATILQKIARQTPGGVKITIINLTKNIDRATIHITAQSETNSNLTDFITGLKEEEDFIDVNLASVSLEQNSLHFTIDLLAKLTKTGGKSS